jgi:AcrR family transcriptional regulator
MSILKTPDAAGSGGDRPAYHHGDLRRALLDAALELLKADAAGDFSLREVARRAGVSHNAPYNHFPDKRALLIAIACAGFETLHDRLVAAADQAAAPTARMLAIGAAYVGFGRAAPAQYRLMFSMLSGGDPCGLSPELVAAAERARDLLRSTVAACAPAGKVDDAAWLERAVLAAWSLTHGLTTLLNDGLASPDTDAGAVLETFVANLAE